MSERLSRSYYGRRQPESVKALRPVYSDTTQLSSTQLDVELS